MHWVRLITFLIAPLLLALAAPAFVLWAWSNDMPLLPALLVGLVFTSLALAIHLIGQALPQHNEDLHLLWEEVEHLREAILHPDGEHGIERRETAEAAEERDMGQPSPQERHSTALADAASATAAPLRPETPAPAHVPPSSPASAAQPAMSAAQEMRLYMEPVVSLENNATIFYRALPALPADAGRIYLGEHAFLRARQQGWPARFMQQVLARCVRFAAQLQARGMAGAVACPLHTTLLEHDSAITPALLQTLEDGPARASVMFVLRREDLTQTSQGTRMQLLMLSQAGAGVVLDMETPDINGFFLPAPLPVRYLDIPAARLAEAAQQPFMQRLGARGWTLVASGIDTVELLTQASACASLGRGRHISPPRRVREPHEAPAGAAVHDNAAAHSHQVATG